MTLSHIARLSTLAALFGGIALHAQLPKDNDVWKTRCSVLASAQQSIENGTISPVLAAATHGVAASKFITFAIDRSATGEHNVSCAMFYLAAIADRLGNGGKVDADAAHDATMLAAAEVKTVHGQPLTFSERFKQISAKGGEILTPSLTSAELMAVIDAASTMPLSLTPNTQNASLQKPATTTRSR